MKILVEDARIIITRTDRNTFKVEFDGIKQEFKPHKLYIGNSMNIDLPPVLQELKK